MNTTQHTDRPSSDDFVYVVGAYGYDVASYLRDHFPAALLLVAQGWTVDSAMSHVQGTCDRCLCTGNH